MSKNAKQHRRHEAKARRRRNRKARAAAATAALASAAIAVTGGTAVADGGGDGGTTPDDGLIAFDTIREVLQTRDIWTIDPDANTPPTTAESESDNPAPDRNAQWSPDGSQIAYVSTRGAQRPQVWLQDAGVPTSAVQVTLTTAHNNGGPVTLGQQDDFRGSLAWSPDGTEIAFVKTISPGLTSTDGDIWVVDVLTGDERQLTDHVAIDANPTWSPDGNYVAFESNRDGDNDIYRVEAAAGNPPEEGLTNLTPGFAGDQVEPDYSRGGYLILYGSQEDGQPQQDIYVKIASPSTYSWQLTTTTAQDDEVPRWSPRNTRFTYASQRDGDSRYDIFTQNLIPDTSTNANVRNNTAAPNVVDRRPDWQFVAGSGNTPCRLENEEDKEQSLADEAAATGTSPLDELLGNQQPSNSSYGEYNEGSSDNDGGVSTDCGSDSGSSDGGTGGGSHSDGGSSD